jgi:hypothetical protein
MLNHLRNLVLALTLLLSCQAFAADIQSSLSVDPIENNLELQAGSYYNWGRGQNGFGYCYQYTSYGSVLNGGRPVANQFCENTKPSYHNWGRGKDGFGYCYQYTPQGLAMYEGRPQSNYFCEMTKPSYYNWGRGQNGYTYCYQYTPQGLAMNSGKPVANYFCGGK